MRDFFNGNRPILNVLLDSDFSFEERGNVIFAEKVFFVNSVIKWCLQRRENKEISIKQFRSYMLLLDKYVKQQIDLSWRDKKLLVQRKALEGQKNEKECESDNLESFSKE